VYSATSTGWCRGRRKIDDPIYSPGNCPVRFGQEEERLNRCRIGPHKIVVRGEDGFEVGLGCYIGLLIDVPVHVAGVEVPWVSDTNKNAEPHSITS